MKKTALALILAGLLAIVSGCSQPALNSKEPSQKLPATSASDQTEKSSAASQSSLAEQKTKETAQTVVVKNNKQTTAASPGTLSTQSYDWYTMPNNDHSVPRMNPDIEKMLADHGAFYVRPNSEKKIYLTFDEGYELAYTPQILDILKANHVHAAFFITGQYIKSKPDLVKRMQDEGHLVCNHTVNHPDLSKLSASALEREVKGLSQSYEQLTGAKMAPYLRPPMGKYSEQSLELTKKLGYSTVFWSIALRDWDPNNQPGADYSYKYVTDHIHPGAVILLHAVSQSDTQALDKIIKDLKSQGYTFSTFR